MQTEEASGTTRDAVQAAGATEARCVSAINNDREVTQSTIMAKAMPSMLKPPNSASVALRHASASTPGADYGDTIGPLSATTVASTLRPPSSQQLPPDALPAMGRAPTARTPPSTQMLPADDGPSCMPHSTSSRSAQPAACTAAPQAHCDKAHEGCPAEALLRTGRLPLAIFLEGGLIDATPVKRIERRWPETLQRKFAKVAASTQRGSSALQLVNGSTWVKLRPGCTKSLFTLSQMFNLILVRASSRIEAVQKSSRADTALRVSGHGAGQVSMPQCQVSMAGLSAD